MNRLRKALKNLIKSVQNTYHPQIVRELLLIVNRDFAEI